MASIPPERTNPLYQKNGTIYTHTSTLSSLSPLSSLPAETQALFKPPPEIEPYILTTPETIFHAQGGGQPSDTGSIQSQAEGGGIFTVHQVRKVDVSILHMGVLNHSSDTAAFGSSKNMTENDGFEIGAVIQQNIDIDKRILHSRLHTAGHVIGLAISHLVRAGTLPPDIIDGKASHYPGAAFVEFSGLIPSSAKPLIQNAVDDLVQRNIPVDIDFWDEERVRKECCGVTPDVVLLGDEQDGVRVVKVGDVGSYPCGGTHVGKTGECGKVVVRGVKRQKGVSKVGYEVVDG